MRHLNRKSYLEPVQVYFSCRDNSVLPSANPIGEIGSGYHTNVYDGNRHSLPILRQKMARSCGLAG